MLCNLKVRDSTLIRQQITKTIEIYFDYNRKTNRANLKEIIALLILEINLFYLTPGSLNCKKSSGVDPDGLLFSFKEPDELLVSFIP